MRIFDSLSKKTHCSDSFLESSDIQTSDLENSLLTITAQIENENRQKEESEIDQNLSTVSFQQLRDSFNSQTHDISALEQKSNSNERSEPEISRLQELFSNEEPIKNHQFNISDKSTNDDELASNYNTSEMTGFQGSVTQLGQSLTQIEKSSTQIESEASKPNLSTSSILENELSKLIENVKRANSNVLTSNEDNSEFEKDLDVQKNDKVKDVTNERDFSRTNHEKSISKYQREKLQSPNSEKDQNKMKNSTEQEISNDESKSEMDTENTLNQTILTETAKKRLSVNIAPKKRKRLSIILRQTPDICWYDLVRFLNPEVVHFNDIFSRFCDKKQVSKLKIKKLAEATYSDVFLIDDLILKIIPLNEQFTEEDFLKECYSSLVMRHKPNSERIVLEQQPFHKENISPNSSSKSNDKSQSDHSKSRNIASLLNEEFEISQNIDSQGDINFIDSIPADVVELKDFFFLDGQYNSKLLKAWDDFHKQKKSLNDRPIVSKTANFSNSKNKTQKKIIATDISSAKPYKYACMIMPFSGKDLESTEITNDKEHFQIFTSLIKLLARLERDFRFEHRDLHWGNLLIYKNEYQNMKFEDIKLVQGRPNEKPDQFQNVSRKENQQKLGKDKSTKVQFKQDQNHELVSDLFDENEETRADNFEGETSTVSSVSLIDFGLSRFKHDGKLIFKDLKWNGCLFVGKGSIQFQVYRDMKHSNSNRWDVFNPYTNVLWLKYVLEKLKQKGMSDALYEKLQDKLSDCKSTEEIFSNYDQSFNQII